MNKKEVYIQKMKSQLEEWQADLEKLKSRSNEVGAAVQVEMKKHIKELQHKIDEGKSKLLELPSASDEAWDSLKDGVETAWDTMKSSFSEAISKFKK